MSNRIFKFVVFLIASVLSAHSTYAGRVYFKNYDNEVFSCDEITLTCNLSENSKLRTQLQWSKNQSDLKTSAKKVAPLPRSSDELKGLDEDEEKTPYPFYMSDSDSIEDGRTQATAITIDVDGKIFRKYVLNFLRYQQEDSRFLPISIKTSDCPTVLNLARDLGFHKLEAQICKILGIPTLEEKEKNEEKLEKAFSSLGQFVSRPLGTFLMGSPDDEHGRGPYEHQHFVTLTPYEVMDAPVTQRAYALFKHENPSTFKEKKYCPDTWIEFEVGGKKIPMCPDHPVENVSQEDAVEYVELLNKESAKLETGGEKAPYLYALPTEARQEDFARAGKQTAYVCDDASHLNEYRVSEENSMGLSGELQTHPVKKRPNPNYNHEVPDGPQNLKYLDLKPNDAGIYHGGVWEWSNDLYQPLHYGSTPVTDPAGPLLSRERCVRLGSSWCDSDLSGRLANRLVFDSRKRHPSFGFRVVRTRKT